MWAREPEYPRDLSPPAPRIIEVICTVTVKEQVSFSPGDAADAAPSESWEGGGSVGGWDQVKEMEEGEGVGEGEEEDEEIAFFCHICGEETLPTCLTSGATFSAH